MNKPPFNVAIIDPPWPYQKTSKHKKLTGYSDDADYANHSMTIEELAELRINELVHDHIFLWTTGPFIEDAYKLIRAWGFEPVTFLAWVKCQKLEPGKELPFKPTYGVGYWFRGCVEPIILAKKPGAPSIRTDWVGLLCENAKHSRKPDTLYELVEMKETRHTDMKKGKLRPYFEPPFIELFGRRPRKGWTVIGNEVGGLDICEAIADLLGQPQPSVQSEREPWDV